MKLPLVAAVLAVLAFPAYADTCEREAREYRDAMRRNDRVAKERAQAALTACRAAEKARYRQGDNAVIKDGPPRKNQAEIARKRREDQQRREMRQDQGRAALKKPPTTQK